MNIKALLLARGEKILLALVVLLCGWWVYRTSTDDSIRFEAVSLTDFDNAMAAISQAAGEAGRPIFREAAPVPRHIRERLATSPRVPSLSQWLIAHPDLDKAQDDGPTAPSRVVVYEILTPRLQVRPRVGSFEMTINLPESERAPGRHDDDQVRIKDGARVSWERHVGFPVRNHARWHSVLLEYAIGEDEQELTWEPVVTPTTPQGRLPLLTETRPEGRSFTVTVSGVEEWARYHFRARLLVEATGFESGQGPEVHPERPREVLVLSRPLDQWPTSDEHFDDLAGFQRAQNLHQAAARQRDGLFVGRLSATESHRAPSTVAICLVFARAPMMEGEPKRARFLVKRKIEDRRTGNQAWTPAERFDVELGDALGQDNVTIQDPFRENARTVVDLRTPFEVESVDPDAERVFYYEVRHRRTMAEDGTIGEARFQIQPFTRRVGQVVLRNTQANLSVPYLSVQRIPTPPERPGFYYSPARPGRDESQEFEERTDDFVQPQAAPPAPVLHEDEERAVLRRVSPVPVIPYDRIQLPYVEMPDGRVLYYDTINNQVIEAYLPRYGQETTGIDEQDEDTADQIEEEAGARRR